MSKHVVTKRRLLWSIIHRPSPLVPAAPSLLSLPANHFHTTPKRLSRNEPSITFGSPETDALIAQLAGESSDSKHTDKYGEKPQTSRKLATEESNTETSEVAAVLPPADGSSHVRAAGDDVIAPELQEYQQWRNRMAEKAAIKTKPKTSKDKRKKPSGTETSKTGRKPQKSSKPAEPTDWIDELIPFAQPDSGPISAKAPEKKNAGQAEDKPTTTPDPAKHVAPPRRLNTAVMEPWQVQKAVLKEKFREEGGWKPRKKLSPDAQQGIRNLNEQDPERYSTAKLAEEFKVSPEAIRRILKSKWLAQQSPEKMQERRERWAKRHDRIYDQQAALGLRKPREKDKEIEDPDAFEEDLRARQILEAARAA